MRLENINEAGKPEETVDYKKIVYILIRQWQWFLLFAVLGFCGAYLYNKLTKPSYEVSTSILVPEKPEGLDMKTIFETVLNQNKTNIYNQIEIIQSYYLINQTLINLNWKTSWYKKEMLIWSGIYKEEPFDVLEDPGFENLKDVAIYITPASDDSYTIKVNGEYMHNKVLTAVSFESKGEFGRPFINPYFNFTLLKKANNLPDPEGHYMFTFNDLNNATLDYQLKLKTTLKNKKGEVILCTLEGDEPVKNGDFLNELLKDYIENKMALQNETQKRSLDFINLQLSGMTDSLNRTGTKFTEFRSRNKIIDIGVQGSLVVNNLKDIELERAKSQMQLDYYHNLLSYLSSPGNLKQLVSPSVVGIVDPSLNSLVLKIGELYNRRQILSFSAKENNPTLGLIDKEIVQIRNLINENLRNLIDNATKTINSLKERQTLFSSELNQLPQKEQEMINIQRQFNLTSEIYTFLLQKRAETNITLASSIPDVQIIDIARPNNSVPKGLPRKVILILGVILGIGLPLGISLLIDSLNVFIHIQEDIENHTKIPILGNIPNDPTNLLVNVHENPKSLLAESFRALRTNLQFMLTGTSGKIISIQSINPGEGKSFVASNLGAILAMNDKKVLVIGADMRKPKLHKTFNLSNNHGLSTYLIGYDTVEQVVLPTHIKNLSCLPSGPIPPNPAEILGKPEMKTLLDQVRTNFDYVIIDNAPVAFVTDGIIMSQLSDLNIFILRYGISRKNQLQMINQYDEKQTMSHMAIVVDDIKSDTFGYSYSKYSRYEYYRKSYYKKNYYTDEDQELNTQITKESGPKV